MTRPKPTVDPRGNGFRLAWSSNAQLWAAATKKLLEGNYTTAMLIPVAYHTCLSYLVHLLEGNHQGFYADDTARLQCPIDPREVRRARDRVKPMRGRVTDADDRQARPHGD